MPRRNTCYLLAKAELAIDEALSEIQIALRIRPNQHEFEELYERDPGRRIDSKTASGGDRTARP